MAIAWSRISSKVMTPPRLTDEACRRRCAHGHGHMGVCIPYKADRRKREVLDVRHAALTDTRWDVPVCVDRLHSASTLTQCRSAPCPHTHETPHTTPKLDGAVIVRRTSASRVTVGRPNTPPKPSSKLFMTWGCLKTSSPRLKDA